MTGKVFGKANIIEVFQENANQGNIWYAIKEMGMSSGAPNELDATQAIHMFTKHINRLTTGDYTLYIYMNKNMSGNGTKQVPFYIPYHEGVEFRSNDVSGPSIGSVGAPMQSAQDINKMIKDGINQAKKEWALERQIEDMRRELKESKKENPIVPYIPAILGFLTGKPQPMGIAGVNDGNVTYKTNQEPVKAEEEPTAAVDTELSDRMDKVFARFVALEGSDQAVVELLEKLIIFCEENEQMYGMLKAQLG